MLNYEKYKEEIENYDTIQEALCYLCYIRKDSCNDVDDICTNCLKESLKFLFSEYKEPIKLTHDEYIILKNIDKEYKWIARDRTNKINLYKNKPYKGNIIWSSNGNWSRLGVCHHLFKFIKWEDEEPYNIQEILNNCEVIDDYIKQFDELQKHKKALDKACRMLAGNVWDLTKNEWKEWCFKDE